jgi:hypothetical protein
MYMPEPEYILKPGLAPSVAKSVLIDIQTKPVPYDKRHGFKKKSRQIIYRVVANDAPALIEDFRSKHSLDRLFVRGIDETPELAALHEKRQAGADAMLEYLETHGRANKL